ncbi:MAG: tetratricopeptide repeat protein [Solirubrobacteraceae bacterium]
MLFDLRSPARRRAIKIIYTMLAILMGVGLVGFGIGGNVSGGIFDASGGCGGDSPSSTFEKDVEKAEKRVQAQPRNAQAWAALARVRYQDAASGSDPQTGEFSAEGRKNLAGVEQAWNRYLVLQPEKRDPNLASLMVQAFVQLDKAGDAVKAQQIVTEAKPSADSFFQLAVYAYSAGQTRTGDLASQRALDLTPKDLRPSLQERIDEAKQSAAAAASGGGTNGGAAPPPSG